MGKFINGINGPIVGKVGTVVGSSINGVPYVKARYKKRTKRISKEEASNRDKFSMAQFWLRPLLGFVRVGFAGYSEKAQGFVAAKSHLLRYSFEGIQPDININPSLVKLSAGTLPLPDDISVSKSDKDQIDFSWNQSPVGDSRNDDQVMMLAYNVEEEKAFYTTTGQFRKVGGDSLRVQKGKSYHVYIAFSAHDRSRQSESVYLGEVEV